MNFSSMKTRITIFLVSIIFVLSCSEESESSIPAMIGDVAEQVTDVLDMPAQALQLVSEPFENVSVPFQEFSYSNRSKKINVSSGTIISIPDNAFVDKNGNPVNGKVDIQYREFHSAGEILTSGITMKYDSAGVQQDFQSAGMFEIRGFENGEEVEIADGKEINIEMASFRDGNYNFYELEEDGWNYGGCPKPKPNESKENKIEELEAEIAQIPKPVEPVAYDPEKFVFDLNIDYNTHPELKLFNGIMWQYAGNSADLDPEKNPGLLTKKRTNVQIVPDSIGTYNLVLTDADESIRLRCVPVYRGKELSAQNEKFKSKFEAYNRQVYQQIAMKEAAEREADILREFGIKSMGIYNYDRQLKRPDAIPLVASFDFGDEYKDAGHMISVFLVLEKANSVIKYPPGQWELFRFVPSEDNKLVAILPGDKVATFSQKDFQALDLTKFSMSDPVAYTFKMKVEDGSVKSAGDVDDVLASL